MEEKNRINEEALENVSGGADGTHPLYHLSDQIRNKDVQNYAGQDLYFQVLLEKSPAKNVYSGSIKIYYGTFTGIVHNGDSCMGKTDCFSVTIKEGSPDGVVGSTVNVLCFNCQVFKNCVKK